MQAIQADIVQIRRDIGDLKADIMMLRVIIENAARLMAAIRAAANRPYHLIGALCRKGSFAPPAKRAYVVRSLRGYNRRPASPLRIS
jgi:hypothetical protein